MNLYVGNLAFKITEDEIKEAFEAFGAVERVKVVTDRETGRPRGFAFVEMSDAAAGQSAVDGLNGKEMMGRAIVVNEARPRPEGGERSGGNGGFRRQGGGERREFGRR